MKKRLFALFLVVVSAITLLACAGGAVKAKVDYSTQTETVITVVEADGTATLIDAMKALKEDGKLAYESSASQYGEFITAIGSKEADQTCEYWAIYCTDIALANDAVVVTVNGQTFYQALVGASSLTVKEGASYLIRLERWA